MSYKNESNLLSHLQTFPSPLRFTELPGGVICMQLGCNASEAGSLLFCCVCTKKYFLSNIFMASCKLFSVWRQEPSHRNCPYGFGKGWFRIPSTKNDGQLGQGKCCWRWFGRWLLGKLSMLGVSLLSCWEGKVDHSLAATTFIRSAAVPEKRPECLSACGRAIGGRKEITLHL